MSSLAPDQLAELSAHVRNFLVSETDVSAPSFTATALTHSVIPVLTDLLAAEREAGAAEVRARVEAIFDLQCPPMPEKHYVDRGAWMAHSWWNTVLGAELRRLRAALTTEDPS